MSIYITTWVILAKTGHSARSNSVAQKQHSRFAAEIQQSWRPGASLLAGTVIHCASRETGLIALRAPAIFRVLEPKYTTRMKKTVSNDIPTAGPALEGQMYLYKQPELLNHQMHGSLGLSRPERPFDFARNARVLPLTLPEMTNAQMFYPIIFTELENPVPFAVVGASDDINLFVDEGGQWQPDVYVPAYVRCYPFSLAAGGDEQYAVVIDRAADAINDNPQQPFFDGESVTPQTQALIDFCGRYDAERRMTVEFGKRLNELGLLAGHTATRTSPGGEQETIANYIAVDRAKLAELDRDALDELMKNGYLACIFAHLFSLENWPRLSERRGRRAAE